MSEGAGWARNPCVMRPVKLFVPCGLVKIVKTQLESNSEKFTKPKISTSDDIKFRVVSFKFRFEYSQARQENGCAIPEDLDVLDLCGLAEFATEVRVLTYDALNEHEQMSAIPHYRDGSTVESPFTKVLRDWFHSGLMTEINLRTKEGVHEDLQTLEKSLRSYTIYPPLMLLANNCFKDWPRNLVDILRSERGTKLYELLCETFKVTHIGLRGEISPMISHAGKCSNTAVSNCVLVNVRRSPVSFTPLYGDFGPLLLLTQRPSQDDFAQAFWCSVRQNGIIQTWAPRYTMFARGNISEKSRVTELESLKPERLGCAIGHTSAVDLYAGIGYFAFSYVKAGVSTVLCWEINPWSVEGLRRGFRANSWPLLSLRHGESIDFSAIESSKMIVFEESNENASERLDSIRQRIAPVRHVNCGYLPSSQSSWKTAIEVLDKKQIGWIHAHENVAKDDIGKRKAQIVSIFEGLVAESRSQRKLVNSRVVCEHLQRVKSYAPGVIHCVFDIAIVPI
ncbi:uncharacterized protein KY384_007833 [Bacidia gigantensis]|uniref:uncharacterized protein n=1 Tax=Bacidia gigantensis TaxID=2732470 RepID=UPI001D047324|nr:uncharacterized protein KY384_007833 [Bacidia gigantensis]KAG8527680.1 hypothetical protein KY384_007833 [Bacidia gigantensis]